MEEMMVDNVQPMDEEPVADTQEQTGMADDLAELFPEDAVQEKSHKKQETVPLKALKEERSKRQQYERQLNELMAMHKEVLGQLRALQAGNANNGKQESIELDDDAVITGADLKRILQAERERLLGETKKHTSAQAIITARQRYEDFDEVVRYADDLISSTPELKGIEEYILSQPNAPFLAYALGKLHPEYQKKVAQKQSLSERISRNMETPQPSRKGSTEVADMYERIMKMHPLSKEFEELDRRIKARFRERGEY